MTLLTEEYHNLLRRCFDDPQEISPEQNSMMHQMYMAGLIVATRICLERHLLGTLIAELNQYNNELHRALPERPTPPALPFKTGN